jgi:hypothetical protein
VHAVRHTKLDKCGGDDWPDNDKYSQEFAIGCGDLHHATVDHDTSRSIDMYDVWNWFESYGEDATLYTPGMNDFVSVPAEWQWDAPDATESFEYGYKKFTEVKINKKKAELGIARKRRSLYDMTNVTDIHVQLEMLEIEVEAQQRREVYWEQVAEELRRGVYEVVVDDKSIMEQEFTNLYEHGHVDMNVHMNRDSVEPSQTSSSSSSSPSSQSSSSSSSSSSSASSQASASASSPLSSSSSSSSSSSQASTASSFVSGSVTPSVPASVTGSLRGGYGYVYGHTDRRLGKDYEVHRNIPLGSKDDEKLSQVEFLP